MDINKNILIILSFVGLWISSNVPDIYEVFLGLFLIVSFGILHGSNDILLLKNINKKEKNHSFFKVLTTYIITIITAIFIFYFIPIIGLLLFIFFSAFHFGEQHWEHKIKGSTILYSSIYYIFYGLFILQLLFIFNTQDVSNVIESISSYTVSSNFIYISFYSNAFLLFIQTLIFVYKKKISQEIILSDTLLIIVFGIIFKVSTLIWGFAIYFILWHSIPSLVEQVTFIYGKTNKKNIFNYTKKAFPYWLISIIGLAFVYFLFKDEKLLYAILFSFIAAVTFPHAFVITKLFKHKKTPSN
jgi:Brp/Blh family beta-carotene 15,15'-monooxygenase